MIMSVKTGGSMFRCQQCNKSTKPNEKETKVVTKTRQVKYYDDKRDPSRITGSGYETVTELSMCEECTKKST